MAKDSTNPIIAKLVLQGLAAGGRVDPSTLLATGPGPTAAAAARRRSILQPEDGRYTPYGLEHQVLRLSFVHASSTTH